jgi:hypothetical protein
VNNITGTWIGIFVLLALYYLQAAQTLEDPIALNMCTTCKVCKGIRTTLSNSYHAQLVINLWLIKVYFDETFLLSLIEIFMMFNLFN